MLTDVAVVIAEPVPAFELGVASEIFGLPAIDADLPRYRYAVCSSATGPLRTSTGFSITPTDDLGRLDTADLIIVTGASPSATPPGDALTDRLRRAVTRGATVAAMCTGAFQLAATGLLDGRTATTHWAYADELARRYPRVTVDRDSIYVVDGPIATSAGSSAAIDLCLHLLRREHGADVANRVAREMVVPAHRSGGQAQFSRTPVPPPYGAGLAELLDWIADHLTEDLSVFALAGRAAMSPRTFIRHFTAATGDTPAAWVRGQRVRHAEQLLERADVPITAVARRCGFGSADTLRRHFRRVRGVTPETYRAAFRRLE
ncbi:GlxA family transcriptional regulator [Paractinoplanes toevensis]|uniref:AraC family transcriptional regulator n=1 Tax=Paractinoplanes toevensis TaxID=571911 RepID=A0A919T8I8_9ACTN|nr:helix-turn-helix domain-containing protein [Actinoplanes toevensis]GIM90975.1 AraC family transcriptional regulator [Actinoplanes toevensis]